MPAADADVAEAPPADVAAALKRLGLAGDDTAMRFTPLAGGVSSDIWKVESGEHVFCVKRARARLAVVAVWEAPVERNHFEAEFLRVASTEVPGLAPELIAEDVEAGLIVLPYLSSSEWSCWKDELMAGRVDPAPAKALGTALGALVSRTGDRDDLAKRFATDDLFDALRLEPYLGEAARRHPDLADPIHRIAETTATTRMALVHGDVSPKNILIRGGGEFRLLDAECAWYGDPAFDAAFFLNHMLLKMVYRPQSANEYGACFAEFLESYGAALPAKDRDRILRRVARLLPALLLARVDGKSPVEYLTAPERREVARRIARRFLAGPVEDSRAVMRVMMAEAGS